MLLNKGCVVEEQETDLELGSLLHVATSVGNLKVVKLLVELGKMPVKIEDRLKVQSIHIASTTNQLDTLKFLEENGANLNAEDAFGNTPLGCAKHFKSEDVIEYLTEKQAEDKPFKDLEEIRKCVSLEMKQEQENTEYRKDGKIVENMVLYSKKMNSCLVYGIENLNFQSEPQSITNV
jgi:ankyrin repeat protein